MITEGKWEVDVSSQTQYEIKVGETLICQLPPNPDWYGYSSKEAEDNARLIAAAPILLEACNSALGGLGHFLIPKTAKVGDKVSIDSRYADLLERLETAIAEAKSTTQASS